MIATMTRSIDAVICRGGRMVVNADQKILSKRKQEIVYLIAQGFSSQEIAKKLYLSYDTISTHRKFILSQLDARNTAELVRVAFERGILVLT